MEYCALCDKKAVMQCDSDQAKLCWNCDERVHSANFLVAKHLRVLLCRVCFSLTTWKGSGPKLTRTVAVCHRCIADRRGRIHHVEHDDDPHHHHHHHRDYVDDDGEYSSDNVYDVDDENADEDEDEEEEEEDEEGENQVVPMSSASATSPPGDSGLSLKRLRDNSFSVDSHGETRCSFSSEMVSAAFHSSDESTSMSAFRPFKEYRINQRNN